MVRSLAIRGAAVLCSSLLLSDAFEFSARGSSLRITRHGQPCALRSAVDDTTEYAADARVTGVSDRERPNLPKTASAQLNAAAAASARASAAGVTRQRMRLLLPRGESRSLTPPDETWEGGIMELYRACVPAARDVLRAVAKSAAGLPPRVREQRLDASGVDGEALLVAEGASAADDCFALVQPSTETRKAIEEVCASAGPSRLVLMINPQYREADDTLDFIASKSGFLGSVAGFLGGKAPFVNRLDELGFADVFSHQEYIVKGNACQYFLAWPYAWQIYVDGDDGDPVRLGESRARPDYNKIAALLDANGVLPKYARETGFGVSDGAKPLTQAAITQLYDDTEEAEAV